MSVTTEDIHSVEDVIDLNQAYDDGRITSMSGNTNLKSNNNYRISLHSIDDDELKRFHRDLVTPAPSVCFDDDHIQQSMFLSRKYFNQTPTASTSYPRPASRAESVMLFKKINNGDEDVSFDLVSSEFKDFLDTDFMDDILSRPVSRTTISKNASKIQDINKFRNTFNYGKSYPTAAEDRVTSEESDKKVRRYPQKRAPAILHSESVLVNNSTSPSLNPQLASAVTKGDNKFRSAANYHHQQRLQEPRRLEEAEANHYKEGYVQQKQQIPRRFASNITTVNTSTSMPTSLFSRHQRDKSLKKDSFSRPPSMVINEQVLSGEDNKDIRHLSTNNVIHRYHTKNEETTDGDFYKQRMDVNTPPVSRRYGQFSTSNTVRRMERKRSDTTSSSSSDEPPEEFHQRPFISSSAATRGGLRDSNPYSLSTTTQEVTRQQKPASPPSSSVSDQYYLQHHRSSMPNARFVNNETTRPLNMRPNKLTSSSDSNLSVTDSAKQVLACIRERRKSAMEHSPRIEARTTRFNSPSLRQQDLVSEFRSKLQIQRDSMHHRRSTSINSEKYINSYSNDRRYDLQQYENNDNRLLLSTSRLPQRASLYR